MVKVNGKSFSDIDNMKVSDFLNREGYKKEFIAVELNGQILPKEEYDKRCFSNEDVVEVVSFVGGGW